MWISIFAGCLLVFAGSVSGDFRNVYILEPDSIRNTYLKTEKSMWDGVVNEKSLSRDEKLKEFYIQNNKFVTSLVKNHIDFEDLKKTIDRFELTHFHVDIVNIHRIFVSFSQHLNRETKYIEKGTFNEEVSLDLIEHVLNDPDFPLKEVFERLHQIIVQEKIFLGSVSSKLKDFCDLHRSVHQVVYQLYDAIVTLQLQAYMMIQSSFMLLNIYEKGDYTSSGFVLRRDYEKKIVESLRASLSVFQHADRSFGVCDPDDFVEGENYLQLTRLLQGYIENEINLNSQGSCTQQCSDYSYTSSKDICTMGSICNYQEKCRGNITNCRSMQDDMWICPGKQDGRRYGYVTYDNGDIMGKPYGCDGYHLKSSYSSYIVYRCEHCLCICDEQGKRSDRYFSLRAAQSDTKNNMVVTGVRFVKKNRMIHLQIQQGQLQSFGKINKTSLQWIPVPRFEILDKGVVDGTDYHTLSNERREIDLDDVFAPVDHIVTGVQLRRVGHHLNLELFVSEYNFKTGRVFGDKSFKVSKDTTEYDIGPNRRREINIGDNPDVPTRTKKKSVEKSTSNTFLKFTHSGIWRDMAQTTIPFMDSQDVATDIPLPLQGVGLYWKSQKGYGGFISPKLSTIDYTSFIKANQQNFKNPNEI